MKASPGAALLALLVLSCAHSQKFDEPISHLEPRRPSSLLGTDPALSRTEVLRNASSSALEINRARVIVDNDAAFDSKIEAIRSAKAGETIRIAYFIYSDDHSSAVFTDELLNASARGVKVKILVDLFTNYQRLDFFTYLEERSRGMIEIRFFGRPTDLLIRDITFLTAPCPQVNGKVTPSTCSDYKWATIDAKNPDFFGRLLLSGMYAHEMPAVTTALLVGQQIDPTKYTSGDASADDKKQLLDFFKLVYDAKIKGDLIAKLKVALALKLYGEKLNPILNEIFGRIPLKQMGEKSLSHWEHSTDFIHHKILIVGERFMQLGGRNLENSYHMKPNKLTDKYTFMDTDVAVSLRAGGDSVVRAYDDLSNFSQMTISLNEVRALMPNEFVANDVNAKIAKSAFENCTPKLYLRPEQRYEFIECVSKEFEGSPNYMPLKARLDAVEKKIADGVKAYKDEYLPTKVYQKTWKMTRAYDDVIDAEDARSLLMAYIENVPYDRRKQADKRVRVFGNETGTERAHGKYIHHLWVRGLEQTCQDAAAELKKNPKAAEKRVILHSAYFLPPAALLKTFGAMMDGTWDCRNVRVTFLSNSFDTTDLNYINTAARYEMLGFFDVYKRRRELFANYGFMRSAKFDYFEYRKSNASSSMSLHTKLSILGDNAIVGSANLDIRSYYMDTNNGFIVMGAGGFTREYTAWIDGLLKDATITQDLTPLYLSGEISLERVIAEDRKLITDYISKFKMKDEAKKAVLEKASALAKTLGESIFDMTKVILSKDFINVYTASDNIMEEKLLKIEEQKKTEDKFNRWLQVL